MSLDAALAEAIEAVRAQVAHLRQQAESGPLPADKLQELAQLTRLLNDMVLGKASIFVQVLAGRRQLDRLPAADLALIVKAITGAEAAVAKEVGPLALPPAKPARKRTRKARQARQDAPGTTFGKGPDPDPSDV